MIGGPKCPLSEDAPHPDRDDETSVTIEHDALVQQLTDIASPATADPDERATVQHRVHRWVDHLTSRTGLLVEQRPGVFSFLHLTLMEFLAARALSEDARTEGVDALVTELDNLVEQAAWHETLLLVIGLHMDDTAFVQRLVAGLQGRDHQRTLLLLQALREEVDIDSKQREQVVREALDGCADRAGNDDQAAAMASMLEQVVRFSRRNGPGVKQSVIGVLTEVSDHRHLSSAVLARLPLFLDDPAQLLALTDRLRRLTRDGEHLYFLYGALEAAADRGSDHGDQVRLALAAFFDHIPAPEPTLFSTIQIGARAEDVWRPIPAGGFRMGSPDDEKGRYDDEDPRHVVEITSAFMIGCVPITNAQYAAFDPDLAPQPWDGVPEATLPDHPRVEVSWYEAVSFCRWLATLDEYRGARLPTEAEWEYACRAGTTTRFWSEDSDDDLAEVGWFADNSEGKTHPVGEKPANPWGLYDMHGNVWEWCEDDWHDNYEGAPDDGCAWIDKPRGAGRVIRGGCCRSVARGCRSAFRFGYDPAFRWFVLGFRVVFPAPEP